jgi:hypothetical protein
MCGMSAHVKATCGTLSPLDRAPLLSREIAVRSVSLAVRSRCVRVVRWQFVGRKVLYVGGKLAIFAVLFCSCPTNAQ